MSTPIRKRTRESVERALQAMDWHPSDNLKRLLLEAVQRVLDAASGDLPVSERFVERLECPECGIPADTNLFPVAVRYHGKGCSAQHKPVRVRYYRERSGPSRVHQAIARAAREGRL